jgi:hypothetical protein
VQLQLEPALVLQRALLDLEKRIPPCLFALDWAARRQDWVQTVTLEGADPAVATASLVLLEDAIRPVVRTAFACVTCMC